MFPALNIAGKLDDLEVCPRRTSSLPTLSAYAARIIGASVQVPEHLRSGTSSSYDLLHTTLPSQVADDIQTQPGFHELINLKEIRPDPPPAQVETNCC